MHPIIEVSVNTLQRDRAKAAIYAQAGVTEYWLVEPEAGANHSAPGSPRARLRAEHHRGASPAQSVILPGFRVVPGDFFARLQA